MGVYEQEMSRYPFIEVEREVGESGAGPDVKGAGLGTGD